MRSINSMRLLFTLFLLLLFSSFAPLIAKAQSGEITGRVVTDDGAGLPNMIVSLAPVARDGRVGTGIAVASVTMGPSRNQASSDEDGNFKFTGVSQGSYSINVANTKGYIRKTAPINEAQSPVYYQSGDNVTITMIK